MKYLVVPGGRRLQLVSAPDALDQIRACVSVGWGLDRTVSGTTTARQLELDSAKSECATRWNTLAPSPAIGAPLLTVGDCLGAANVDETRSDATSTVEVHYPSIEVAQLIAFTKDLSKAKAFTMPFSSTSKTPEQTRTIQGTMTLTLGVPVVSTLQVLPADEKLYGSWLPVPGGAPMKVLARLDPADVSAKADFLDFSLTDVTAYPGSWGNSRDTDLNQTGPDLVFAQTQEDPNVQRIDELHARTITKVKSAKVLLEVRDFAAFGVVKVRAREQAIEGKTWPEGSPGLSVPRDREGNKVGDAWEEQHQNVQLDLTWDQEEVKGRKAKGDNLSYLEEYRGFKVLVKGKEEHLRLSPDKQEIFVCDPENVALEDAWEKASQTKMIKIARSHLLRPSPEDVNDAIEWRTVDTRGDKNKHAAYISYVRSSDPNFDPANSGDVNHCGYLDEWQAHIAYTSDCDGLVHLFDARFRGSFETYRVWVDRALAGDPWAAGALANVAKSHRVSLASLKTLAKQRAASWSADADIGSLTREHSNFIVLHEIAHMLRAPGHLRPVEGVELPQESTQGDLSCPMAYSPMEERLELIIYGAKKPVPPLRGRTRFCSGGTDDCFGDIDCRQ